MIIKELSIKQDDIIENNKKMIYSNPLDKLPLAKNKDFGDYNNRRKELLKKKYILFKKRIKLWEKYKLLPEINSENIKIIYPEGNEYNINGTIIRFTQPLFHGIEFASVGWIFATIVEYNNEKFFHSSDLSGPMIEDYADFIIKENPTYLFLDGPTTYLLGYILNNINLNRCIQNTIRILKETDCKLIIYDHHLLREKKFRERTKDIWKEAKKLNKKIITSAEYLGKKNILEK
jgi:predicted metallo-beta-lactamase superfamily hydrolase